MGVLIPVGFGQATFVFRSTGATKDSTFSVGYNPAGPVDPVGSAASIASFFASTGRPFLAANMTADWSWLGVQCVEMDEDGPHIGSNLATVTGSIASASPSSNCAILITKNTTQGGRKGRGRIFCPPCGFAETGIDNNGNINTTARTAAQALWNAAWTAWVASTIPPVLLHSEVGTPTPIGSVTIQPQIATQRRRMRR